MAGYHKQIIIVGLRSIQLLATSIAIVGFIWGSGDWLLLNLKGAPMTPLSIIMMLYGSVGTAVTEAAIKIVERTAQKNGEEAPENGQPLP